MSSLPPENEIIQLAESMAETSRDITMRHFRHSLAIEDKQDESPVTIADRETELALRKLIREKFPGHGIVGEEFGAENSDSESTWIIDPIDGTSSFICGLPLFSTLISLIHEGQPVLGVIDMPALDERWLGLNGERSFYNQTSVSTSECGNLSDARLMSTTPDMFNDAETMVYRILASQCKLKRFGADGYAYGLLASGHIDLVVESDLKPYDYMAHVAVIEGAGGIVTDWQGEPLNLNSGPQVIAAATAELHSQALNVLNRR